MPEKIKRSEAGMANPSSVPNTALLYAGWLHDTTRRPYDVKALNINNIIVGKRERQLDRAKIQLIANSIRTEGLLQPIGVRLTKVYNKYDLIYGFHRLEAVALINQENPLEGHSIVAVIFPEEMPDWGCKLAEIAENLARVDLSQREKDAQTLLYGSILKRHGLVGDAITGQARNNQYTKGKVEVSHSERAAKSKPTITQKVTADLGISPATFNRQVERGKAVAQKAGLVIPPDEQTPETMSADTMMAIGEKMAQATDDERKDALKKLPYGTSWRQSETKVRAILDTEGPEAFINWCRERIKGKHKPMSLDILKAYRKALDELIAEVEGKP